MVRNALIAGATGLVGNELVTLLIKSEKYGSIHILTRRPFPLEHHKIKSHLTNFENIDQFIPNETIHDVYICLGTTMQKAGNKENFLKVDSEYVLSVGRWAKRNNAANLAFVSSVGANPDSKAFYLATKGKVEMELVKLGIPKIVIIRPSLLLGKREEYRFAEKMSVYFTKIFKPIFIGKLKRYRPVEAVRVAQAMIEYSVHPGPSVMIIENEKIFEEPVQSNFSEIM
jgi:uncharacterized protein YbjT (DUF2867 family)